MRAAVVFGQFDAAADPVNLPQFENKLKVSGFETVLVQHTDTQKVYDFLRGYKQFTAIVGASLGAGVAPIMAGYLRPDQVNFVGGFQPSDWDPVMHTDPATGLRAVSVANNVSNAMCFRNPIAAATGGLGHAIYVLAPGNQVTKLEVIERPDIHPGDFGVAADQMLARILSLVGR